MAVTIDGNAGVTTNVGAVYNGLQTGTAVASTSGTNIDFTGIPSWVKRITVILSGVSTNGTSNILCRLGDSGGIVSSGYVGNSTALTNAAAVSVIDATTSLPVSITTSASNICVGQAVWVNVSGNAWVGTGVFRTGATVTTLGMAAITLSGALTQLRITTSNGTDTFDAGTINIIYE
jgi:hypothetical protein